jgi:RNA polymerase sigma-70 factor (ECF subfamily)
MEDRDLVTRARRGDAAAFTALVERYERPMYAAALSVLRSEWDAADAVQEAFIEALAHLGELRDPDRFRAWLSRIVINKCHQAYRASSRLVVVEEFPEEQAPARAVSREQTLDLIHAVQSLDEEHRMTVALRYFCDLKLDEVARVLECPVGTVKSRLNRALCRLQAMTADEMTARPLTDIQEVAR